MEKLTESPGVADSLRDFRLSKKESSDSEEKPRPVSRVSEDMTCTGSPEVVTRELPFRAVSLVSCRAEGEGEAGR
jgi:hypothetical protein